MPKFSQTPISDSRPLSSATFKRRVQKSIDNSTKIVVSYKKESDGTVTERTLEPYEILTEVLADGFTKRMYLYAEDSSDSGEERHIKKFIVKNIRSLEITSDPFVKKV